MMQTTGPNMDKQAQQTTHDKVVLFADVSGSTRLYEVLGDARAFAERPQLAGCGRPGRQTVRPGRLHYGAPRQ